MPKNKKKTIQAILIIGDSLTDRGAMNRRKLWGTIPMDWISGLRDISPDGRFTNGYNWADSLAVALISSHELDVFDDRIQNAKKVATSQGASLTPEQLTSSWKKIQGKLKHTYAADESALNDIGRENSHLAKLHAAAKVGAQSADLADSILSKDKRTTHFHKTHLDKEDTVYYKKARFIRSYAEGGMTSFNFKTFLHVFTANIKHFFSRLILKSLAAMRRLIQKDEAKHPVRDDVKAKTLVIEWSGANDLATVSSRPTIKIAKRAVKARIENLDALYERGYRNFVLFNMPNLALTPRYQNTKHDEVNYAYTASRFFNNYLNERVEQLSLKYPDCHIQIFDADKLFEKVYQTPESYGFDRDKMTVPFLDIVKGNSINEKGQSPSEGYAFWDDVYPTMDMQMKLCMELLQTLESSFDINPEVKEKFSHKKSRGFAASMQDPLEADFEKFKKAYGEKLNRDYYKAGGEWTKSKCPDLSHCTIDAVIDHGLMNTKSRTFKVMQKLGWFDEDSEVNQKITALRVFACNA